MTPERTDDIAPDESVGDTERVALQRLRSRFLAGLPQRWAEIVSSPPGARRAAALHRLTGAAGGYGFLSLSDAARRAEQADGAPETLLALRREIEAAGVTLT